MSYLLMAPPSGQWLCLGRVTSLLRAKSTGSVLVCDFRVFDGSVTLRVEEFVYKLPGHR